MEMHVYFCNIYVNFIIPSVLAEFAILNWTLELYLVKIVLRLVLMSVEFSFTSLFVLGIGGYHFLLLSNNL